MYKILSNEYSQLSYRYKQICKNFKDEEQEKKSLMTKLSESHALIDSLKSKISMLVENNISRENDLKDCKELSQKFSSDNLKSFFYVNNKHSMIVDNVGSYTSHASKYERKTLFAKPVNVKEVKANIVCLDKSKTSCLNYV